MENSTSKIEESTEIVDESEIKSKNKSIRSIDITLYLLAYSLIIILVIIMININVKINKLYDIESVEKQIELRYNESSRTDRIKGLIDEIDNLYGEYYIGEIDYDLIEESILNGYVEGTKDKYGSYLTEKEASSYSDGLNEILVGVGIEVAEEGQSLYVTEVYDESPAKKSGMKVGDVITGVENKNISELGFNEAIRLIRGEQGTKVNITLKDRDLTLTRDKVTTPYIRYDIINDVGYIKIKRFAINTGEDFKDILDKLKDRGINKFVFDLRGNGGGLLESIIETLDYLLPEGLIVRIDDKYGEDKEFTSDKYSTEGEMVVLVDGKTASAAELFTLALMDYDKATVVGTQTYGKGTSAITIPISKGAVNISTALYHTKSSNNIEGVGITPDIILSYKSDVPLYKAKYSEDNQLQKALEILK